jgi:hypothetical protein
MRERARSIGGSLSAAPRPDARGFAVTAELPTIAAVLEDPDNLEKPEKPEKLQKLEKEA